MKTPAALQPLIDEGVIDEVIRSLKNGKLPAVIGRRSAWNGRIGRTSVATRGACPGDCAVASRACGYWDLLVPLSVAGFAILKTYGRTHSRRALARARLRRLVRNSSVGQELTHASPCLSLLKLSC